MTLHAAITRLLVIASASLAWGQSTTFNATFATAPPMGVNQFQLQEAVSVLMSAGNVYYDESMNCVPLQAYEITDQNGNPLGPYLMTTSETDSYVLDVTSLISGAGVKPFYRSQELTDATDRAWRLDYYKPDAQSGQLWTTVMSGPITPLANGDYELSVDLGLRWSEEGDNLNRLGQGQFSHIALAIGDFRSFNLKILSPGSALLTANVITANPTPSPTAAPSTSEPTTAGPTPAPTDTTSAPSSGAPTGQPVPTPTMAPHTPWPTVEDGGSDSSTVNPVVVTTSTQSSTDDDAIDRQTQTATATPNDRFWGEKGGKGGGKGSGKGESGCWMVTDKKGKAHMKGGKGCKGLGHQSVAVTTEAYETGGLLVGATAAVFLMAGWMLVAHRQRQLTEGYEPVDPTESFEKPPAPTLPTAFAAFGTFSQEELKDMAATMRLPPTQDELVSSDGRPAIN